ncbi:type III secretion system inner membrane ring subunit SctD [Mailhella sp.]|uniref:type III secretion system inner membrane ring subunit SctD n=1 Tax=Mailhella sp. TaxID=1981029 RepID=UPI004063E350
MAAILRIFSGLHLGAEIELAEGIYVIGTDDSCDLILSESSLAPRHAALRVSGGAEAALVSAGALDGAVMLGDTPVSDECDIPSRTPFQLGLLIAAWIPADTFDQAAAWTEVEQKLRPQAVSVQEASLRAKTAPTDRPGPSSLDARIADDDVPAQTEDDAGTAAPENGEAHTDVSAPRTPHRLRDLSFIAAIILAGTLCFTWDSAPEPSPVQTMRALLDEAGYTALNVGGSGDSVVVTGRIATDRERGRLLRLAQLLEFPVYLDVTVHSDAADAVRASFNMLGLWPEVTELPPSSRPGVRVRGYIKSGVLEQQALSTAVRNVPDLRPAENGGKPRLEIFRDIRHEEDVQTHLTPALTLAGLGEVQRIFHPGRIELRGSLTPQSKAALEDITAHVQSRLGVPVPFDIVNEAEVQTQKTNIYADQRSPDSRRSARQEGTVENAFKVVSVSMGAMKFATLANGERVFEGGELPGGYVLEHIDVDELTLRKNGTVTPYPLRGDHE